MNAKLHDPDWLQAQIQIKTLSDIGEDLGVSKSTVSRYVRKHNLEIPGPFDPETKAKLEDRNWLFNQIETSSPDDIAKLLGVSKSTVIRRLNNFDIKTGPLDRRIQAKLDDRNWLINAYETQSTIEMAASLGVSDVTVGNYMRRHGLDRTGSLDPNVKSKLEDAEWLHNNYETKGIVGVASVLGVSNSTVCNYMDIHGLDRNGRFVASSNERELIEFVESLFSKGEVLTNDRSVIYPKELDIFVPSKSIAIEFNGLYWHTERTKPKFYHYNKWLACRDAGVQLIQIWEDEWRARRPCVEAVIRSKLGINAESVFARKCSTHIIDSRTACDFWDEHHIQGKASSTVRIGLYFEDVLVAVCGFKKRTNDIFELVRFASSVRVIGGFSKCMSEFLRTMEGVQCSELITFADLCISDGGLYEKTGWTKDKVLKPDYKYFVKPERKHKFNYRKTRFKEDPNLLFDPKLTEPELAELNGLERIWDCGKIRYRKETNVFKFIE